MVSKDCKVKSDATESQPENHKICQNAGLSLWNFRVNCRLADFPELEYAAGGLKRALRSQLSQLKVMEMRCSHQGRKVEEADHTICQF